MIQFTTTILKFGEQGDKTGWRYILIPADLADKLLPNNKKAFRVKGSIDDYQFEKTSLLPMGGGSFMMALKATVRKKLGKNEGAMVKVKMQVDAAPILPPAELIECLSDEPKALAFFKSLAKSHQNYFANWIKEAKTDETKAKRIAQAVNALAKGMGFGETIRSIKAERDLLNPKA